MLRLPVCCVLGLLLAMTSPGLTAPTTMPSLDGVLSGIPGLPSFVRNMDARQLVAKVAELHSRGRLAHYLGVAEMFLGLPRGQGSELERANAIIDAMVPQPQQAALLKAEVTSVLNDGATGTSTPASAGPQSVGTLRPPGNPGFSVGLTFPPSVQILVGATPGDRLTGNPFTGSGFNGNGLGTTVGPSSGQNGKGAGDFPWPFSSEWQFGASVQWLFEKLLGGGSGQGGPGGQNAGGWGQGPQAGQGPQGGKGPQGGEGLWLLRALGDLLGLLFPDGNSSGGGQGGQGGPLSLLGVQQGPPVL